MSLLHLIIECGLPYYFHIVIYSHSCYYNYVILLQIGWGNSEHARISEIVTTSIGHRKYWVKKNDYFGRYEKISKLKDYIDFHVARKQYKEALKRVDLELQERCEAHVRDQLKFYNDIHLINVEDTTWGWSPLYQVFLRFFLKRDQNVLDDTLRRSGCIFFRPCK